MIQIFIFILSLIATTTFAWSEDLIKIDKTEVSIGAFAEFIQATGLKTKAEQTGGMVYEFGWVVKPNWNWRKPYGFVGHIDEPAVHITFDEAQLYCNWRSQRLPNKKEWIRYAYTENRNNPSASFIKGKTYLYPTGDGPKGANCLSECGYNVGSASRKTTYSKVLFRGSGHTRVGITKEGVNGLFDMGANVWEWAKIDDDKEQATMGGSWWYGEEQMKAYYRAQKPKDMAAVYIGFRCITD
jgi:sulfatase modifying factor 1